MHQKLGGANTASAVWMKIYGVLIAAPALYAYGLPDQPMFYILTGVAAIIWCVNDLIYFNAVKNHGASLLSRLSPLGIILGFIAWFFVKPELLALYLQDKPRFIAICAIILLSVISAIALKSCPFSRSALKSIWFVIVGATIGILLVKSAVDHAPAEQGVFGYVGFEAGIMLAFYTVYFSFFRRGAFGGVFSRTGLKTGGIVGGLLVLGVITRIYAQKNVDHPAFVSLVSMLDVVWLLILTRISGWKDDSNKIAGFGIVLAALALAVLKIR